RRSRATGGGSLLDLAVHHIDFARFALAAEVKSVTARIESKESDHDFATLTLTMSDGTAVEIKVEFGGAFRERIEVHGEKATLWFDRAHSVDVGRSAPGRKIGAWSAIRASFPTPGRVAYWALRRRSPFHEPSYAIALSTFVDAAIHGTRPAPDLMDGLAALAVIDAAERSSASGQPVSVA
ncbi:MAG: Gfo/Idh/MocA family oxidoreductase, partial [Gemmatimonadales bacterium]